MVSRMGLRSRLGLRKAHPSFRLLFFMVPPQHHTVRGFKDIPLRRQHGCRERQDIPPALQRSVRGRVIQSVRLDCRQELFPQSHRSAHHVRHFRQPVIQPQLFQQPKKFKQLIIQEQLFVQEQFVKQPQKLQQLVQEQFVKQSQELQQLIIQPQQRKLQFGPQHQQLRRRLQRRRFRWWWT